MLNRDGALYLCNLGTIPLFAHPSALMLVVIVGSSYQSGGMEMVLAAIIVTIVSIILHELGHGMTAMALGASDVTITLEALGGVCRSNRDSLPARELPILIAGPAVSYALWGGGWLLWTWASTTHQSWLTNANGDPSILALLVYLTWRINMILAIFNSLPIYPLDGGQVLFNFIRLFPRSWNPARLITLCVSFFVAIGALLVLYNLNGQVGIYTLVMAGYLLFNAYRALH
ncbi:MAG: M50 family metallopeptidase [Planctomycetes bacterium]|nr:M50 family metallopeptidase [Planctomycetota bacterium]